MFVQRILQIMCFLFLTVAVQSVFAQGGDVPRYIESEKLIIAAVDGTNEFQVFSTQVGQWSSFVFPDGVKATPVVGTGVCTFSTEGEELSEIVAVDFQGKWCKQPLPKPATQCTPIISQNLAVFVVDGRAYAFSAEVGKWDSIDCPVTPRVSNDVILIVAADWISAFSGKTGKWSTATTKKESTHP